MHWAVLGVSGCGKSRLLKQVIIPTWRRAGVPVAVLDPLEAPDWHADMQDSDPARFMNRVKKSSRIVVVIDEVAQVCAEHRHRIMVEWAATVARNRGILSYFLAQRAMQVHPNIRNQCTNGIIFNQPMADLEEVSKLLNQPDVMQAANFPKGIAALVRPFEKMTKIKVF